MAHLDKLFGIDGPVLNYYSHISSTPTLPLELVAGQSVWVDTMVADDVSAAAEDGRSPEITLTVRFDKPIQPGQLRLRLGGNDLPDVRQAEDGALECRVASQLVIQGPNRLEVSFLDSKVSAAIASVKLSEVRLSVHYP